MAKGNQKTRELCAELANAMWEAFHESREITMIAGKLKAIGYSVEIDPNMITAGIILRKIPPPEISLPVRSRVPADGIIPLSEYSDVDLRILKNLRVKLTDDQ